MRYYIGKYGPDMLFFCLNSTVNDIKYLSSGILIRISTEEMKYDFAKMQFTKDQIVYLDNKYLW